MKKLILGSIPLALLASVNIAHAGFYKDAVYKDAMPVMPWTGLYVGVNGGYGWGSEAVRLSSPVPGTVADAITAGAIPSSLAKDPSGWLGGLQVGYNFQMNQCVFGIEADWQWADIEDSKTVTTAVTGFPAYTTYAKQELEALGTIRARAGMLAMDPLLVYVTGGFGYARTKLNTSVTSPGCVGFCGTNSSSDYQTGWVLGVGAEYLIGCNWSAKLEYLYYNLGSESQTINAALPIDFAQKVDFKGNIFRAGVNYKFM